MMGNKKDSIYNPELYGEIMNGRLKYYNKLKTYKPKRFRRKRYFTLIKWLTRLVGYGFIPFNLTVAAVILIISVILGIVDELS